MSDRTTTEDGIGGAARWLRNAGIAVAAALALMLGGYGVASAASSGTDAPASSSTGSGSADSGDGERSSGGTAGDREPCPDRDGTGEREGGEPAEAPSETAESAT